LRSSSRQVGVGRSAPDQQGLPSALAEPVASPSSASHLIEHRGVDGVRPGSAPGTTLAPRSHTAGCDVSTRTPPRTPVAPGRPQRSRSQSSMLTIDTVGAIPAVQATFSISRSLFRRFFPRGGPPFPDLHQRDHQPRYARFSVLATNQQFRRLALSRRPSAAWSFQPVRPASCPLLAPPYRGALSRAKGLLKSVEFRARRQSMPALTEAVSNEFGRARVEVAGAVGEQALSFPPCWCSFAGRDGSAQRSVWDGPLE